MSSLTLIFTVLAAASSRASEVFGTIRRTILTPIGRVFDFLLAPVDRAFRPLAKVFNRTLGKFLGTVTGLQLAFVLTTFLLLLTGGIWGASIIAFEPGEGLIALDIRRPLAYACIWAVFAMGWDIQSGYTGYISFGHSVLSGGAAYTTAVLLNEVSSTLPLYVTAPISVFAAVVIGLLIALPSLRLQGPYFSLITFAAVLLFFQATRAFDILGGSAGLRITRVIPAADSFTRYYLLLIPMLLIAVALTVLSRSNYGLIFTAIRENEDAVSAAGINPTKFKIWSFLISSIVMGIGGVMLTAAVSNVDPTQFVQVDRSIEMIAMAVVGGIATVLGAMGGAFVFFLLKEVVLNLFIDEAALRLFVLFLLVVLILVFARDGLFRKLWHRLGQIGGEEP
ncbi:branched-chain amino acid ABC transporter permease [Halovenus sp. WSH3]|uniref:Branched-chain amino acid ABC transporter permease n=1 Tax=Halovenus carboxidivorans TaxID=2692199 RepID=A0A6B0T832_9EURY|nr:branched-chain amino acid ABC transporter permease [Halovenus carboxidivorans]MXR51060.1 branched-chain amino acid ABC transporter permease [Halovenus carboxidivorans]